MRYLREEKGNALLLVLLVTVILSTIGLAVVSSTIGGAKRTTVRVADVDVTYEAVKAVDSYTAALSDELRTNSLLSIANLSSKALPEPSLETLLSSVTSSLAAELKGKNTAIDTITVDDITERYISNDTQNLTRVLELSITAIESDGAAVSRTAQKELIVSPLPSFLKYALGSENGTLSLNGSPHLQGDIFANKLSIDKNAYYSTSNDWELFMETPMPSISGDLYVGTPGRYADWNFDLSKLTNVLVPENFYYGKVPLLKNDSQYQSVQFQDAYIENRGNAESETELLAADSIAAPLNEAAKENITTSGLPYKMDSKGNSVMMSFSEYASTAPSISDINYVGDTVVSPGEANEMSNINIKGSLTVIVQRDMKISDISVSGGILTIINNDGKDVELSDNIVSDQGIVLENGDGTMTTEDALLYDELAIDVKNEKGSITFGPLYSRGDTIITNNAGSVSINGSVQSRAADTEPNDSQDLLLTNRTGQMTIAAPLWSGQDLRIENSGDMKIEFAEPDANTISSLGNISIHSTDLFTLKNHLEANGSITLDLEKNASVESLVLSNDNINLYAKDSNEDNIHFDGSLFTDKNLTIQGNDEQSGQEENDLFSIRGTMYAQEKTTISNLSIRGWEEGQLISLSGGSLLITRINEFQNFDDSNEPEDGPYVPTVEEFSSIQPLKGFFYTDKNVETSIPNQAAAELYGVGSLFFVDGGLFAKGDFVINAVRGKTRENDYNITSAVPASGQQKDHFSRFIINYDRNILLDQLDYLPQVDYLSVYSDQLTVE